MEFSLGVDLPQIVDEAIRKVSLDLGLGPNGFHGYNGRDPRIDILKFMGSMDVAACPGAGKTTLLVAKLALLADKWPWRTHGICVLSHTNAAREQIESRLGNTAIGRRILSYPHFVGTIHAFANEFLAKPWLRSRNIPVKVIDTEYCQTRRWRKLGYRTQSYLERNSISSTTCCLSDTQFNLRKLKGSLPFQSHTNTYKAMQDAFRETTLEGYHCYDDMFVWANEALDVHPEIIRSIRARFPLLFLDEAQDNSEVQSSFLHRVFTDGEDPSICQRLGDENQSIFESGAGEAATTNRFPIKEIQKSIPNSYRFGQTIASIADPLCMRRYDEGLKGLGPLARSLVSEPEKVHHTILLFDEHSIRRVLDAYAELIISTFSTEGLQKGRFAAVGHIHKNPVDENDLKFPQSVGSYWDPYDPALSKPDPTPDSLLQYIFAGFAKAEMAGGTWPIVSKIAEAILHLVQIGTSRVKQKPREYSHRHILNKLEGNSDLRRRYLDLVETIAVKKIPPSKESWNGVWSPTIKDIVESIAGSPLADQYFAEFVRWHNPVANAGADALPVTNRDNVYRYSREGKDVRIQLGSIHSVKGKTVSAMLVLETFWKDHNLQKLVPWLCGKHAEIKKIGKEQNERLKLHYVAMTRPTDLLCLAMKASTFRDNKGEMDEALRKGLEDHGWRVQVVDGALSASESSSELS
jgi:DNA helicase II / ATP-dependent DNA helicase PcrA